MTAFLVTGNPGSGKTTVAHELTRRGFSAIDPDDDPRLAYWEDETGRPVDRPQLPNEQWLSSHRWVWRRSRLQCVLSTCSSPIFVCGIARNQAQFLDLFERVFLLQIDAKAQEARLAAYDQLNPPGRTEATRHQIRVGRPVFEAEMLALGATAVDGRLPTEIVVDRLLASLSRNER